MASRRELKDRARKAVRRADGLQLMLMNREAKIESLEKEKLGWMARYARAEEEIARLRAELARFADPPGGVNAQLIADMHNYPVHVGCGGEVFCWKCQKCDSVVSPGAIAYPEEK